MKITLKTIRKNCGYTVNKMAEMLDISPKTYAFYEKRPWLLPADLAVKISVIGNISPDYIFFG